MSWPLRNVTVIWRCVHCRVATVRWGGPVDCDCENRSTECVDVLTGKAPVVGDWFYRPDMLSHGRATDSLSPKYFAQHAAYRPPITVVLPDPNGTTWWCVDEYAYGPDGRHGEGWDVVGIPPSCSPSINVVGRYHGYVKDGVVTDDCEGRTCAR